MKLLQWIAIFIAGFALATALVGLMVDECQPEDWFQQVSKIEAVEAQL